MEAIGLIGFSFGALGFLFSTISKLAEGRDKYKRCMPTLRRYRLGLLEANAEMEAWNCEWPTYGSGYERYKGQWGGSYDAIVGVLEDIRNGSVQIKRVLIKVAKISQSDADLEHWHQKVRYLMKDNLLRLAMVLYKHDSLGQYIRELKDSANSVSKLARIERQRRLQGNIQYGHNTLPRLERFVDMLRPVAELYEERRRARLTGEWALLLCPQEDGRSIGEWEITHRVTTHFTFSIQAPGPEIQQSLRIFCSLNDTGMRNVDWPTIILGQTNAPEVAINEPRPPTRITRSFRELFMEDFFGDSIASKAWEPERASLLLALANWTFLLWHTEWTTNLCCSGLRLVKPMVGGHASIPTFVLDTHMECGHHSWKLVNFGLVLAEVILAVPLRIDQIIDGELQYVLARKSGQWTRVELALILGQVKDKAKSESVYMAIRFCLDQNETLSNGSSEPYFLLTVLEKVFKPVEKWCQAQTGDDWLSWLRDLVRGTGSWPDGAFTDDRRQPYAAGDGIVPGGWPYNIE